MPPRLIGGSSVLALGGTLAAWATVEQSDARLYQGGLALVAVMSGVLVLAAVQPTGPVRRLLSIRPLPDLGRISYGVYLYHWPIFLWLTEDLTGLSTGPLFAVRMAATLTLAALSYVLVEQPIRSGRALRPRTSWLAGPVTAVGLAASRGSREWCGSRPRAHAFPVVRRRACSIPRTRPS